VKLLIEKFQAIVVLDKNAYFQGEPVTGKVVLGRYDPKILTYRFQGPGKLKMVKRLFNDCWWSR
jgi:hypothetical protein